MKGIVHCAAVHRTRIWIGFQFPRGSRSLQIQSTIHHQRLALELIPNREWVNRQTIQPSDRKQRFTPNHNVGSGRFCATRIAHEIAIIHLRFLAHFHIGSQHQNLSGRHCIAIQIVPPRQIQSRYTHSLGDVLQSFSLLNFVYRALGTIFCSHRPLIQYQIHRAHLIGILVSLQNRRRGLPFFFQIDHLPWAHFQTRFQAIQLIQMLHLHAILLRNIAHGFTILYGMIPLGCFASFRLQINDFAGIQHLSFRNIIVLINLPGRHVVSSRNLLRRFTGLGHNGLYPIHFHRGLIGCRNRRKKVFAQNHHRIVLTEAIFFDHANQNIPIIGIGGITRLAQAIGPSFIIGGR